MLLKLDVDKIRKHHRYDNYVSWFHEGISFDTIFQFFPSDHFFGGDLGERLPLKIKGRDVTYHIRKSDVTAIPAKRLEEWL